MTNFTNGNYEHAIWFCWVKSFGVFLSFHIPLWKDRLWNLLWKVVHTQPTIQKSKNFPDFYLSLFVFVAKETEHSGYLITDFETLFFPFKNPKFRQALSFNGKVAKKQKLSNNAYCKMDFTHELAIIYLPSRSVARKNFREGQPRG